MTSRRAAELMIRLLRCWVRCRLRRYGLVWNFRAFVVRDRVAVVDDNGSASRVRFYGKKAVRRWYRRFCWLRRNLAWISTSVAFLEAYPT